MYTEPKDLWEFGRWVNGGHWSTCEARMIMAYYRLGKSDDARRSMKRILDFARRFRMDNNLTNFGSEVYQPKEPINCVYDTWGVPAALIRGLFEYLYQADGLDDPAAHPAGDHAARTAVPDPLRGQAAVSVDRPGSGPVTGVQDQRPALEANSTRKKWTSLTTTSRPKPGSRSPWAARPSSRKPAIARLIPGRAGRLD